MITPAQKAFDSFIVDQLGLAAICNDRMSIYDAAKKGFEAALAWRDSQLMGDHVALSIGRAIDDAADDYRRENKGYMHGGEYLTELGKAAIAAIMGKGSSVVEDCSKQNIGNNYPSASPQAPDGCGFKSGPSPAIIKIIIGMLSPIADEDWHGKWRIIKAIGMLENIMGEESIRKDEQRRNSDCLADGLCPSPRP